MNEQIMQFLNNLPEPNKIFSLEYTIDENLRTIKLPYDDSTIGVEGDKDVNIVQIRMNRYYNGIDLSTFSIYVNVSKLEEPILIENKIVKDSLILFTWNVGQELTNDHGDMYFSVSLVSDELNKTFNTTSVVLRVLESLKPD